MKYWLYRCKRAGLHQIAMYLGLVWLLMLLADIPRPTEALLWLIGSVLCTIGFIVTVNYLFDEDEGKSPVE